MKIPLLYGHLLGIHSYKAYSATNDWGSMRIYSQIKATLFKKRSFVNPLLILPLALIGGLTGCAGDSTASGSSSTSIDAERSYPVQYVRSASVNPATLSVVFRVKNDGTVAVTPTCFIEMKDVGGTYKGFDSFELVDSIPAGVSKEVIVQLTITNEGADYADQFSGKCTANTSDKGTSTGKDIKISNIENMSATDASEGWYWGATFKADVPPMTEMNCNVKALDAKGKVVATTSYPAKTLNDGTVIGTGNESNALVDSTKSIVQSIRTFEVACTL